MADHGDRDSDQKVQSRSGGGVEPARWTGGGGTGRRVFNRTKKSSDNADRHETKTDSAEKKTEGDRTEKKSRGLRKKSTEKRSRRRLEGGTNQQRVTALLGGDGRQPQKKRC